ncbi:hypothetical protein FAVG1_12843 [Fusarium avenaceum]|nr:hypothetical protein FAVG1_12843 [Fusarium avenaceum]
MCNDNSPTQCCGIPISTYHSSPKPKVEFCTDIQGTILNALLHRADQTPKPAHKGTTRPPYDKEISKDPAHYWPLVERCHLKHKSDVYSTIILPAFRNRIKFVLRVAMGHGALAHSKDDGWLRGLTGLSDRDAGRWLEQKTSAADIPAPSIFSERGALFETPKTHRTQNIFDAGTQRETPTSVNARYTTPKSHRSLGASRWANYTPSGRSQSQLDSMIPDLGRLSLADEDKPPSASHKTSFSAGKTLFPQQSTNVPPRQTLFNSTRAPESPKRTLFGNSRTGGSQEHSSVDEWRSQVAESTMRPAARKKQLQKTLERLGQEKQDRLREIRRIAEQEAKVWASI